MCSLRLIFQIMCLVAASWNLASRLGPAVSSTDKFVGIEVCTYILAKICFVSSERKKVSGTPTINHWCFKVFNTIEIYKFEYKYKPNPLLLRHT